MKSSLSKIVFGICLYPILIGCPGMAPQGATPTAAQREESTGSSSTGGASEEVSPGSASSNAVDGGLFNAPAGPGAPKPSADYAANQDKPHPGGVSAAPVDPNCEGGGSDCDKKKTFDYIFSGAADPLCVEEAPKGAKALVQYFAKGNIGAVLLDGTDVDLYHCEALTVRFQSGSGIGAACEDIPVKANCQFSGTVSFHPDVDPPQPYLFTYGAYGSPIPGCGEVWDQLFVPDKIDLPFSMAPTKKIPVCKSAKLPLKKLPKIPLK